MPVTFSAAPHSANSINRAYTSTSYTAKEILAHSCRQQSSKAEEILQFAFSSETHAASGRDLAAKIHNILPNDNGFVRTVIRAYNDHHALVIRPDDVWLAILSQFNFFVNANAELLRASFVAHEGKKNLKIEVEGTRYNIDFGAISRRMVDLIEKNVVDPTLREWVLPNFTTTTVNDTTASAILMMATLKEVCSIACGIPRVTLEGEKSDWVNILERLEKLKEYGVETIAWYHLLRPVIARFVAAFDTPNSPDNVDFWQKVAHYHSGGSGPSYYSGWINAFNVFSEQGGWLGHELDLTKVSQESPEMLPARHFWATYAKSSLRMDLSGDVPPGDAEVEVKLNVNGEKLDCVMIAGTVGTHVTSSEDLMLSSTGKDDVVRPVTGWWIFTKQEKVLDERDELEAMLRD
ncbi:hypothetical protein B0H19DRAFT_1274032 [Mycena capillaripes]|nr:hypothetical protein B0H19DRAFT_1274032 [Mycena capillaripes]